jgi:hypothetical protein
VAVRRRRILIKAIALWDAIYPGQERRDLELITASYQKQFERLSPEQLEFACAKTFERLKFFPTPAEIFEFACELETQGLELEAARAWQTVLHDFREWGRCRDSHGKPLPGRTMATRRPRKDCPHCDGTGFAQLDPNDSQRRHGRCVCTVPAFRRAPELPAATTYALDRLGSYETVARGAGGDQARFLQKDFVEAWLYFRRTDSLEHLPAGKTDAALLKSIEHKAGRPLLSVPTKE